MTDTVPAHYLGRVLGMRSIFGIGAGSFSPITFGLALDVAPAALGWGYGFCVLALGGAVAFISALMPER